MNPVRSESVAAWLQAAVADARRRGLPELEPLLDGLAQATEALRSADFNAQSTRDNLQSVARTTTGGAPGEKNHG